jgi:hypothetical protein
VTQLIAGLLRISIMRSVSGVRVNVWMEYVMRHGLITFGLVSAFALTLSTAAALAQPGNFDGSQQPATSAESSPLLLVRGGGGGGGGGHGGGGGGFGGGHGGGGGHGFQGGGGHGFHGGRGFRGGRGFGDDFGFYGAPYDDSCWWSQRYGRVVCYWESVGAPARAPQWSSSVDQREVPLWGAFKMEKWSRGAISASGTFRRR